jgi:ATP-dependent RNA helicase DeaD
VPAVEIAAALAKMTIGEKSMLLGPDKGRDKGRDKGKSKLGIKPVRDAEAGAERFRIEVGHEHGVKPGNIVGAIANESGLDGEHIGSIEIEAEYSLVDLPAGIPKDVFEDLKKTRICGQLMNISRHGEGMVPRKRKRRPNPKGKPFPKGKPKGKSKSKGKFSPAAKKKKPKRPST